MKTPDLYIIANGSTLRAFQCKPAEEGVTGAPRHLTELTLDDSDSNPKGNIEENSDRQGRFNTNQGAGNHSNLVSGEQHSLAQENEKRQSVAIAGAMQRVLEKADASSWSLVAPAQWKNEIVSHLRSDISKHLRDSIEGDWTKMPVAKIEDRLLG